MKPPPRPRAVCLVCRLRRILTVPSSSASPSTPAPASTHRRYLSERPSSRPATAPKPILDIRHIARNPGLYEQNCLDRNYTAQARDPWRILALTQERHSLKERFMKTRTANNAAQQRLSELYSASAGGSSSLSPNELEEAEQLRKKTREFKEQTAAATTREKQIEDEIYTLALALPNLSSAYTPNGSEPAVVSFVNPPASPRFGYTSTLGKSHVDIGAELGILDFASAATTSGWGWYNLKHGAALLEQALIQYALQHLLKRNFTLVSPPSIVYSHIAAACGFQPRDQNGEQQIYALARPDRDAGKPGLCLAGTSEIPLAGMYAGRAMNEDDMPIRTAAVSRCYRAEAGARGADTRGLYRVHEFTKVEMFVWTLPDDAKASSSDDEGGYFATHDDGDETQPFDRLSTFPSQAHTIFDEMLEIQRAILDPLYLPYRVLEMPATDLGASAARKHDIEVLFPSRRRTSASTEDPEDDGGAGWGEVTSTSLCTDYQSRRLGARIRRRDPSSPSGIEHVWPYTLNGTAMAVPRVLAAILETHFDEQQGCVHVPEALWPYMMGVTKITKAKRE